MSSNQHQSKDEGTRKKKESIVDLSRFIDKKIRVKFQGGREAAGILKGYDALLNLVLDNCVEYLRDPENPGTVGDDTRSLGLIVARGTAITVKIRERWIQTMMLKRVPDLQLPCP
nr:Like-Sm ribonucleoprotein domain containing protein [Haemonchus contortus]